MSSVEQIISLLRQKLEHKSTGGGALALKAFKMVDKDNSGSIDKHELLEVLQMWNVEVTPKLAGDLFRRLDSKGTGVIDYEEFVEHLVDQGSTSLSFNSGSAEAADQALKKRISAGFKNLRDAFRHYDTDHNGAIDLKELRKACDHAGISLSKVEAGRLMSMIDTNHDGKISNAEFMKYLGKELEAGEGKSGVSSSIINNQDRLPLFEKRDKLSLEQILNAIRIKITNMTKGGPYQARNAFLLFDKDHSGTITLDELEVMLRSWGIEISPAQAKQLMRRIDSDGSGGIDYNEFIEHIMDDGATSMDFNRGTADAADKALRKRIATGFKNLRAAFRHYDANHDGVIDLQELRKAADHAGVSLGKQEALKLLKRIDQDGDGKISNADFMHYIGADVAAGDGEGGLSSLLLNRNASRTSQKVSMHKYTISQIVEKMKQKIRTTMTGHDQANELYRAFRKIDLNQNAVIDGNELARLLDAWGIDVSVQQSKELMKFLDLDGSGVINFKEFMEHMLDNGNTSLSFNRGSAEAADQALKKRISAGFKNLRDAFRHYDSNHDGMIDLKELRKACDHAGISLSKVEAGRLMSMIDTNHDGKISNAEFMKYLGKEIDAGDNSGSSISNQLTHSDGRPEHRPQQHYLSKSEIHARSLSIDQLLKITKQKLASITRNGANHARLAFRKYDVDGSGQISVDELKGMLQSWDLDVSTAQAQKLMKKLDDDGSGQLDYEEFIEHIMDDGNTSLAFNQGTAKDAGSALKRRVAAGFKNLRDAFRHYDTDKDGMIDLKELRKACNHAGISLSKVETEKLMAMVDGNHDGRISNAEFMHYFGGKNASPEKSLLVAPTVMASFLQPGASCNPKARRWSTNQIISVIRGKLEASSTRHSAQQMFRKFDANGSGSISKIEMSKVLQAWDMDVSEKQLNDLMKKLDADGSGTVDYKEFIEFIVDDGATSMEFNRGTAKAAHQALLRRVASGFKNLRDAFRHYDTNHDGVIDLKELRKACDHAGISLSKVEAEKLMAMFDDDHDGKISNAEFMRRLGNEVGAGDNSGFSVSSRLINNHIARGVLPSFQSESNRNSNSGHELVSTPQPQTSPTEKSRDLSHISHPTPAPISISGIISEIKERLGEDHRAQAALQRFDPQHTGNVKLSDFASLLLGWGIELAPHQFRELAQRLEVSHSGRLNYARLLGNSYEASTLARMPTPMATPMAGAGAPSLIRPSSRGLVRGQGALVQGQDQGTGRAGALAARVGAIGNTAFGSSSTVAVGTRSGRQPHKPQGQIRLVKPHGAHRQLQQLPSCPPTGRVPTIVNELQAQLARKWKSLLRHCRALDIGPKATGELNRAEFREALRLCDIEIAHEGSFGHLWDEHAGPSRAPRYAGSRTISYRRFMRHFMLTLKSHECAPVRSVLPPGSGSAAKHASARLGGGSDDTAADPRSMWARQTARKAQDPYVRMQPVRGQATADGAIDLSSSPRVRAKERASRQYQLACAQQQGQVQGHRNMYGSRTERGGGGVGGHGHGYGRKRMDRLPQTAREAPHFEIGGALKQQVAAKWKSIRKACQSLDASRSGSLSLQDVHSVLLSFGVAVSITEVAKLPRKATSEIMYNAFVKECLKTPPSS